MESGHLWDSLFLERLDAFLQKNVMDISTFAAKEGRTLEEVRGLFNEVNETRPTDLI